MLNSKVGQIKTCIVLTLDEMSNLLSELFDDIVEATIYDFEFDCNFTNYEPDIWYDEVIDKLSEYYGLKVTSIHIDQCDYPLVWVCYKNKEEE